MATLSAIFKGVDQLSNVLSSMSDAGADALEQWERSADAVDDAFAHAADGADDAARQLDDYGDHVERAADQSEDFGETSTAAVEGLAGALTSAGIVVMVREIGQAFLDASDAAAAYETSLAKVSTISDPAQASLSSISSEITALSMETGKAVADLSEATYQAISASVETKDAVAFAGTATELSVGGFTSAATAVDVLTTALNSYNLETTEATSISDMLITTQNLGKTSVDQLATNMGRVIPLASAYSVEMDNLSTSYAVMTANGIATAETTTYIKSMLSELGSTSSTVSSILMAETGRTFAELSESGYSLGDVLDILGDSVNGNTTAFNALWSSQEAGVGALSLYNAGVERYNDVLDAMQNSTGAAASAYEAMTSTTEHGSERMENSFNNLKVSVGTVLNPTFGAFYNTVANGTDAITGFISEHPAAVAVLTSAAAAIGVVTLGVVALNTATTVGTAVMGAFSIATTSALWPVVAVAAGVAALAAGVTVLVNFLRDEDEEFNALDATSKQHTETLADLNQEYDRAVALYGENSEQAQQLEQDIAGLEAQFEATEGSIDSFINKNDALVESHNALVSSYTETSNQLDIAEKNSAALADKLDQLAGKSDLTAGEQQQLEAIISKLNSEIPGLALSYDRMTGSLNKSTAAVKAMAAAEVEERRTQANFDAYVGLLADQAALEEQLAVATEQAAAAQERYDSASGWDRLWNIGQVKSDLKDFTAEQERLQVALDETNGLIADHEAAFEDAKNSIEGATVDYETAVTEAVTSVAEDMDELAQKYDETWQTARDSISGQIGLFDTMKTETETSISDMTSAMQSQIDYLTTYAENLQKAAEYGLDQGLIQSLSDGSTESAGYINTIIENIERLGGTTEGLSADAASFVNDFNTKFQEVNEAKDQFATTVATIETDFDAAMTDIEGRLDTAIDNMNMETEAAVAAKETIDAYVSNIRAGVARARRAADAVASATTAALTSTSDITGYADGTTYAEAGVHIVGENGPEALFFHGGETVLNANDTRQYLAGQRTIQTSVPEIEEGSPAGYSGERRIVLELAGRGSIELSGNNYDADAAAEWLEENLRPMLIKTLKQEIFEEGDGSYGY